MTIEKTEFANWEIYSVVDGILKTRIYNGFTKKEAIADFKNEFRKRSKGWLSK